MVSPLNAEEQDFKAGFSEYWRKNKSPIEPVEMAYALKALRKVGGYIASNLNLKTIEWAGMSDLTEGKILLDPGFVLGDYPIPPGKMDVLVGWVAHEALHCKELSDLVWITIEKNITGLGLAARSALYNFVETAEDIYINYVAEDNIVWRRYISNAWKWFSRKISVNPLDPPTLVSLFQIWGEQVLENKPHHFIHPDYIEPLNFLLSGADEIKHSKNKGSSSERSNYRVLLYQEMWEALSIYLIKWKTELPEIEELTTACEECKEDQEKLQEHDKLIKRQVLPLSADLELAINKVFEEDEEDKERDLTRQIKAIAGEESFKVIPTRFGDETKPCRTLPDPYLVKRLKLTFLAQQKANPSALRVNRGLYYGKIDGRRLYRAPLEGRVFKEKERIVENKFWNITILVDASVSMALKKGGSRGGDWLMVQNTYVSLYEAAKGFGNKLNVFCYQEQGGRCYVMRVLHHNKLYTALPEGRTPTGQAIIAAGLCTPKDKKRLIIHLTDGEPNCGASVNSALKFCQKQNIDLITIGYGFNDELKEQFQDQYGSKLYLMESIEQLPAALEFLLKRKLLEKV